MNSVIAMHDCGNSRVKQIEFYSALVLSLHVRDFDRSEINPICLMSKSSQVIISTMILKREFYEICRYEICSDGFSRLYKNRRNKQVV